MGEWNVQMTVTTAAGVVLLRLLREEQSRLVELILDPENMLGDHRYDEMCLADVQAMLRRVTYQQYRSEELARTGRNEAMTPLEMDKVQNEYIIPLEHERMRRKEAAEKSSRQRVRVILQKEIQKLIGEYNKNLDNGMAGLYLTTIKREED